MTLLLVDSSTSEVSFSRVRAITGFISYFMHEIYEKFYSFVMTGWKHRENFKAYYQTFAQGWEIEQQGKERQKQMQMMQQQIQGGGMGMGMPPPDHFQQQMPPFGGTGQPFPPQHLMGLPPPNMIMGQQFPPQYPMGMPPSQTNMMGHQSMLQGPGPSGPQGFRPPPMFQPPPLFPQQMQVATGIIHNDINIAPEINPAVGQ